MLRKPFSDWFGGKWSKPINKRLLNRNDSNLKLEPKNRRQMKQIVSKRKSMMEESNLPLTVSVRFKYYCYQHIIYKSKMNI